MLIKQHFRKSTLRPVRASDSDEQIDQKLQKTNALTVTFSLDTPALLSPSTSVASSMSMKDTVSARAERSLKRQRQIEKEQVQKRQISGKKFTKQKNGAKRSDSVETSTTIFKKGPNGKKEEVVKVKLNTGTLFLYKGINRRAVFIRRN